jgi:poly(3-hydroxybutyrate) depolymerase
MVRTSQALVRSAVASAALAASFFGTATQAADVRVERVSFTSGGQTLVGKLYVPAGVVAAASAM